jgi:hypothetical protein
VSACVGFDVRCELDLSGRGGAGVGSRSRLVCACFCIFLALKVSGLSGPAPTFLFSLVSLPRGTVHLDVDNEILIARAAVWDGWLAAIDLSSFRRSVPCSIHISVFPLSPSYDPSMTSR